MRQIMEHNNMERVKREAGVCDKGFIGEESMH